MELNINPSTADKISDKGKMVLAINPLTWKKIMDVVEGAKVIASPRSTLL